PNAVPEFHPLCVAQLKDWPGEGGAFDMAACATRQANSEILTTADGVFYAAREGGGYFAYKPIGVLDQSMEILLTYDKVVQKSITAVYFIGRIPGPALTRDFLTTVEEGGDRCQGGVNDARLISASILEVDINATAQQMVSFLGDTPTQDTARLSFNRESYQAYACAGTITKRYNLLDNQVDFAKVTFIRDESRKRVSRSTRCYDNLVAQTLVPPVTLNMQEYRVFLNDYHAQCGRN
ncbi:MAG: hypothetical protein ACPG4U_08445, partial [Pseudomonadales bacterium]